jgi:alpha-tubulin suppressor-like RCC1 family protein
VATTPKPVIIGLAASPSSVNASGGQSTISASVLNATSCMISATPAVVSGAGTVSCSGGTVSQAVTFAQNTSSRRHVRYKITLTAIGSGGAKGTVRVDVLPAMVTSLTSTGYGSCALLTSDRVDCWGDGVFGQLGNGTRYDSSRDGSATPVQVEGVGGTGALSGVASLTGTDSSSACALLDSSGVDCWGFGDEGQLGSGTFTGTDTPVQVEGVGGSGILTGVRSLTTDGYAYDMCAVLAAGGVDCWGAGGYGQLGNGTLSGSDTPVQVEGVGGSGILTGVTSLTSDSGGTYCALLSSGGVDCWGAGTQDALGNGTSSNSTTPVQVEGVGGSGTLAGVAAIATDQAGFCALLHSGGVDCWGSGASGDLGNGMLSDSATPVQVVAVGGSGTLAGVASLVSGWTGYCAILGSGGVDCWGRDDDGELGNGDGSFANSATPVQVEGVGGSGTLAGVKSVASLTLGYCAVLDSGGVDCWGLGHDGQLGNGHFYKRTNYGSPTPVQVMKGPRALTGVASVTGESLTFCAVLDSGGVDCWGWGVDGELGHGGFLDSAHPVRASFP